MSAQKKTQFDVKDSAFYKFYDVKGDGVFHARVGELISDDGFKKHVSNIFKVVKNKKNSL